MFRKISTWTIITVLSFISLPTFCMMLRHALQTNQPAQNARIIAEMKAKKGAKCTPLTNKNCFTLTPAQLQQIKKIQNGLSRKKDQ
jgi:hypothetical protein